MKDVVNTTGDVGHTGPIPKLIKFATTCPRPGSRRRPHRGTRHVAQGQDTVPHFSFQP